MSSFEEASARPQKPEIIINPEDFSRPLSDIQQELVELIEQTERGISIDETRFDYLIKLQEHNKEYQKMMEEERENWIESVGEFCQQCLERMRSFIPLNIFDCSVNDLVELGLSSELAKRIIQRQCLWLVRMSEDEIARLHESDLLGRFNSVQQNLDIIETAAVYWSLPKEFPIDLTGKKKDWRNSIEDNLRKMLLDNDEDKLPDFRIRNPVYNELQYGPIKDLTSVRQVNVVKAEDVSLLYDDKKQRSIRKSFIDICTMNSIVSKLKNT